MKKTLRMGFTTGSCAAAAACAAAQLLVTGKAVPFVMLHTPKKITIFLEIAESSLSGNCATCAVLKDSGDDPDVTNGVLVYATVSLRSDGEISIDGGEGVGRVTLPGLDQAVGSAAINSVPRQMIRQAVRNVLGEGRGAHVVISIPAGRELAARTFNPRLGIVGGISVLGTSGIVEPMSEDALRETIRVELNIRRAQGMDSLVMAPGNYGRDFLQKHYGVSPDTVVLCSNFIAEAVEMAAKMGFRSLLFAGHIGKLVKVAAGVRNTHSKYGDGRMATIADIVSRHCTPEAFPALRDKITACVSCDEAVRILKAEGLADAVLADMGRAILQTMSRWAGKAMQVSVIVFSNVYGVLYSRLEFGES